MEKISWKSDQMRDKTVFADIRKLSKLVDLTQLDLNELYTFLSNRADANIFSYNAETNQYEGQMTVRVDKIYEFRDYLHEKYLGQLANI